MFWIIPRMCWAPEIGSGTRPAGISAHWLSDIGDEGVFVGNLGDLCWGEKP